jgi:seryl-tRNA synthetase
MNIQYIRENPEKVKNNQIKRFKDHTIIDLILNNDNEWKNLRFKADKLRSIKKRLTGCFKNVNKTIEETIGWSVIEQLIDNLLDKTEDEKLLTKDQLKFVSRYVTKEIDNLEEKSTELLNNRDDMISELGNLLHKSVPIDCDETNNITIYETFNKMPNAGLDHIDLLDKLGFVDTENGIRISGNRGYFFTGQGVRLNQALINYSMDFMENHNYKLMETPHFVNQDIMSKITQLSEYKESLYKLENYDKYLIATSEQPLTAYFANKTIKDKDLPTKLCGISHCYRKETGAHARHTRGIYRVHQFQKLEQFCVTDPSDSDRMFGLMIENSKQFYESLGISFRIINIVSGALNNAASIKYDLEAYYPGSDTYCELVSCTNVLDYFSKRIGTKGSDGRHLHMLNCTLMANTRTICALVETYQTDKGFVVPTVLRKYMNGIEFIPFVN